KIIARERELEELEEEQRPQPDEFVFDQTNTISTNTHPAEEWNMVPTSNFRNKIKIFILDPMNPYELDQASQTLNHSLTKATLAVAPKKKKKDTEEEITN
ncbi:Hypothetical predicted protein, partial [Mytilus galloprovincialis]